MSNNGPEKRNYLLGSDGQDRLASVSKTIRRVRASSTFVVFGFVSLTFVISPVRAQSCNIGDTSEIDETSHEILHDFENQASGCAPDFGPSGIVYHPGLDSLVVISDKRAQFAILKTDGSGIDCKVITDEVGNALVGDDHEGVTYADPDDGFIYVGVESGPRVGVAIIRQVQLSSARVVATWKVGFPGGIIGNAGLESITFVRDASHAEGGTFYVGDQTARRVVGKCEVPIKSGGDPNALYGCSVEITPQFEEVSGLDYVAGANIENHHNVLLLSSDSDDRITAYTLDGESLNWSRDLPDTSSPGQEGHAIRGCELYVSSDANDDSRKIHRYRLSP